MSTPHPRFARLVLALLGLALLGLTVTVLAAAARAQKPEVTHFTREDGLPGAVIYDVVQHPSGRLWILTRNGIATFDGQRFEPVPVSGLPTLDLAAAAVDTEGQVWTVTRWRTPQVLRFSQKRWHPWALPPVAQPQVRVNALAVLSGGEGRRIAVGLEESGLWLWEGEAWSLWTTTRGLPADSVRALEADGDRFAVGTASGLCYLDERGLDCDAGRREPRLAQSIRALHRNVGADGTARLWAFSDSWLGYLSGDELTVVAEDLNPPVFDMQPYGSITVDGAGGVYFGLPELAFFFDPASRRVGRLGVAEGLVADGTTALVVDRESNVWVGSLRGLSRVGDRRFLSYGREHGLLEDEVSAIVETAPGRLVLGHNGGLTFFDHGEIAGTLSFPAPDASPPNAHRVLDMAVGREGTVWIAGTLKGLLRLESDRSWHRVPLDERAFAVEFDTVGRLWICGAQGIYVGDETEFTKVELGFDLGFYRWLTTAPDGGVYVATTRGVLFREHGGEWRLAQSLDEPTDNVFTVHVRGSGAVWVGSRTGLHELIDGRIVPFRRGALQIDHPIYFILDDPRGRTWFGTDDGVLIWNGASLRRLSHQHGLAGRETNRGAGLVDHAGRVWIGTDSGLSVYQPHYDRPRSAPPRVELAAVDVNSREMALEEPLELGPRENNLKFFLERIALSREENVWVRYRLEPFDRDWQGPSLLATTEVRYTNVPPGIYRFHAAAGWSDGPWGADVVSVPITIRPPYWRRPWFLALALAGAAVLAAAGDAWRTHALRSRQAELEAVNARLNRAVAERQRLIAELEARNSELERFSYTVSHDLKSPIVTIMGFLGHLKADVATGDVRRIHSDIGFIEGAAGKMGRLLDELLELSRVGRVAHQPEEIAMGDVVADAVERTRGAIDERGARIEVAPDLPRVTADRVRLVEVWQNLIENAVRYMGDQPEPEIEVGVRNETAPPIFFVRDNGMGIEAKYHGKIFGLFERLDPHSGGTGVGLALVRRIVEVHGGLVWVESAGRGRGSTFCFTVPSPAEAALPAVMSGVTDGG